ncbi:MAG: SUMF1/EgtB/PvdO family nonheme iron enzyme [Pseudomonadota bacterium]
MRTRILIGLVAVLFCACVRGNTPGGDGPAPSGDAPPGVVCVPPGEFLMGSPASEPGRGPDEASHRVRLSRPFLMDATEVTAKDWRELVGPAPGPVGGCGDGCPVALVSWYDALAYLNARSRRDGLEPCYVMEGCVGEPGAGCPTGGSDCRGDFRCDRIRFAGLDCPGWRLPSEAEWEYAARAGSAAPFPAGSCISRGEAAFDGDRPVDGCPAEAAGIRAVPAGSLPSNAWGLHEMRGNLYEWVWDSYRGDTTDDATDPLGPEVGDQRVVRGGAYAFPMASLRAAHRSAMDPERRSDMDGFRAVRTAGPAGAPACH